MFTIDRYIARILGVSILLVLLAFLAITTIFGLIDELRGGNPSYKFIDAAQYIALTIPRRTYEVLPYVSFIGALLGLSVLSSNSEIVVLRAAGVSISRIFSSTAFSVLFFLGIGILLGEYVGPAGEQKAESFKARALQKTVDIKLRETHWYREGPLFMSIDGVSPNGTLRGIRQYWRNELGDLVIARKADRAEYRDADPPYWLLYEVTETVFSDDGVFSQGHSELKWAAQASPRLLGVSVLLEPRKLSIVNLYHQISYMQREGLEAKVYELAFWRKCFQPMMVLGLTLMALYFVLGPLRDFGIGGRITLGIFVGLGFKYLQDFLVPLALIYDFPVFAAVISPIALSWLLGWFGLNKVA